MSSASCKDESGPERKFTMRERNVKLPNPLIFDGLNFLLVFFQLVCSLSTTKAWRCCHLLVDTSPTRKLQTMADWWGGEDSGDDSDLYSTDEEDDNMPKQRIVYALDDSSSDDGEKRVVKSKKESAFDDLQKAVDVINKKIAINDWVAISTGPLSFHFSFTISLSVPHISRARYVPSLCAFAPRPFSDLFSRNCRICRF